MKLCTFKHKDSKIETQPLAKFVGVVKILHGFAAHFSATVQSPVIGVHKVVAFRIFL